MSSTKESQTGKPSGAQPSDFSSFTAGLGLPAGMRVLAIGPSEGTFQETVASIATRISAEFLRLASTTAQSPDTVARQSDATAGGLGVHALPRDIGLCAITTNLVQLPNIINEFLFDRIHDCLSDGGLVAFHFCRDASDAALAQFGNEQARLVLQKFMKEQFGGLTISDPDVLAKRFADCAYYQFLGWFARSQRAIADEPIVWVLLRKRPVDKTFSVRRRALPRAALPDQFLQGEFGAMMAGLRAGGISVVPVDEFARRYEEYYREGAIHGPGRHPAFGHVKFDIHGNIQRPLELARLMSEQKIPGLFLAMHDHPVNHAWYGSDFMWQVLSEIRDLGHEIGLHADPFCLIRTHGDLLLGLEAALGELRAKGFAIRAMTLHGDTRQHIKTRRLQANDFFIEEFRRTKWDGVPPRGEEFLADHVRKYSHAALASELGIEYIPDVNFVRSGELLTRGSMLYLSDNQRTLKLGNIPPEISDSSELTAEKAFRIDPDFIETATNILERRPFLALFHPQWYW